MAAIMFGLQLFDDGDGRFNVVGRWVVGRSVKMLYELVLELETDHEVSADRYLGPFLYISSVTICVRC